MRRAWLLQIDKKCSNGPERLGLVRQKDVVSGAHPEDARARCAIFDRFRLPFRRGINRGAVGLRRLQCPGIFARRHPLVQRAGKREDDERWDWNARIRIPIRENRREYRVTRRAPPLQRPSRRIRLLVLPEFSLRARVAKDLRVPFLQRAEAHEVGLGRDGELRAGNLKLRHLRPLAVVEGVRIGCIEIDERRNPAGSRVRDRAQLRAGDRVPHQDGPVERQCVEHGKHVVAQAIARIDGRRIPGRAEAAPGDAIDVMIDRGNAGIPNARSEFAIVPGAIASLTSRGRQQSAVAVRTTDRASRPSSEPVRYSSDGLPLNDRRPMVVATSALSAPSIRLAITIYFEGAS
jgi:hypothetical protein